VARSKILRALFFLAVVAMPFDGVPGLGALGELAHEGSFYLFFPTLMFALMLVIGGMLRRTYKAPTGARWVWWAAFVLLGSIAISGVVNIDHIMTIRFHDRSGLAKMITSAGVVAYGFALAWLATSCVGGRWYEGLILPLSCSVAICIVVCIFEEAGKFGLHIPPFQAFYKLIHSGAEQSAVLPDGSLNLKLLEGWDKRLRSVSFEPPSFGNFNGLVWPWLACGALMTRGVRRMLHTALLAALTVVILIAGARTGSLLLAADVGTLAALWLVFLPHRGRPIAPLVIAGAVGLIGALFAGGIYYVHSVPALEEAVVKGHSISDLSRLAWQVAAFKMFFAHPIFGVGLGQFAFSANEFMPDWGFLSSEIRLSLLLPDAPWPNTYSLDARTAAEMGIVGLMAWLGIWTTAILGVRKAGLTFARAEGRVPWPCYAIVMSIVAVLVSGFTTDTYRTPMIWITLGAAAYMIERARAMRRTARTTQGRLRLAGLEYPGVTRPALP
jgi:hypothetical protein